MSLEEELKRLLASLTPREREVLKKQFGIDVEGAVTAEQLAAAFDKTRHKIREIEKKALKKLKGRNDDPTPKD